MKSLILLFVFLLSGFFASGQRTIEERADRVNIWGDINVKRHLTVDSSAKYKNYPIKIDSLDFIYKYYLDTVLTRIEGDIAAQTLQEVTDKGNSTTNELDLRNNVSMTHGSKLYLSKHFLPEVRFDSTMLRLGLFGTSRTISSVNLSPFIDFTNTGISSKEIISYSNNFNGAYTDRTLIDRGYANDTYIPRAGTFVDKPITGNLQFSGVRKLYTDGTEFLQFGGSAFPYWWLGVDSNNYLYSDESGTYGMDEEIIDLQVRTGGLLVVKGGNVNLTTIGASNITGGNINPDVGLALNSSNWQFNTGVRRSVIAGGTGLIADKNDYLFTHNLQAKGKTVFGTTSPFTNTTHSMKGDGSTNILTLQNDLSEEKFSVANDGGLTLNSLSSSWKMRQGNGAGALNLQNQISGQVTTMDLMSKDLDGTDNTFFRIFSSATDYNNTTDFNAMLVGYFGSTYKIYTQSNGTIHPLRISSGFFNTDQVHLANDGNTGFGKVPSDSRVDVNGNVQSTTSNTPTVSLTLGAGATTFAVTSNSMKITGDAGGNTIATITGAKSGTLLRLIFVDANVTITDDNINTANTINLSAAFTSAANSTLLLEFDGTSWREMSRSNNG